MSFFSLRPRAAVAALTVACLPLLAACGEVRAGSESAQRSAAGSTPAPPPTLPAPVSGDALAARDGRLIAQGPGVRVEEVRLAKPVSAAEAQGGRPLTEVVRLTVSGRFGLRDMPLTILVEGTPAGQAVEARDLKSAVVALPDRSRIKDGAAVSYRYGNGPVTVVGKLKVVR